MLWYGAFLARSLTQLCLLSPEKITTIDLNWVLNGNGMFYYFAFSYFGSYNFICGNYRQIFSSLSLFLFVSIACRQLVNGIHSNAADNIEPLRRTKKYSEEGKRQSQRQSPRDEKFVRWQRRRQLYLRNFGDKIPCKFTTLLEFLKTWFSNKKNVSSHRSIDTERIWIWLLCERIATRTHKKCYQFSHKMAIWNKLRG